MIKTINIGKIDGRDTLVELMGNGDLILNRLSECKKNWCSFYQIGKLNKIHYEGGIWPIDDCALTDPVLDIKFTEDPLLGGRLVLGYRLTEINGGSFSLSKEDIISTITAQHDLAEKVSDKLKNIKLSPEEKEYKLELELVLENIRNLDVRQYESYFIVECMHIKP